MNSWVVAIRMRLIEAIGFNLILKVNKKCTCLNAQIWKFNEFSLRFNTKITNTQYVMGLFFISPSSPPPSRGCFFLENMWKY